jgi:hypothetical protein
MAAFHQTGNSAGKALAWAMREEAKVAVADERSPGSAWKGAV